MITGKSAFKAIYDRLASCGDDDKYQYAMVAYHLYNTLTENGHVARGVCTVDADGHLADIHERTRIEKHGDQAEYTEDDRRTWEQLGGGYACIDEPLGLYFQHLKGVKGAFCSILEKNLSVNPLKCSISSRLWWMNSERGESRGDRVKERGPLVRRDLQGR